MKHTCCTVTLCCNPWFRGTIPKHVIPKDAILKNSVPMTKSLSNTKNDKNNSKYANSESNPVRTTTKPKPIFIFIPNPDRELHLPDLNFSE